ncbi:4Fe-4S binding protein [Microvirga guangxiensis]|uniref:4Fe-4S dicluster domain-containing protein n=1 Tax=Microvirga guangxiensis TaxID=549386 RepID=A0A1G5K0D1_9HYPH|nr:4Fe-4S dicluster domain-containing protein [Microvirga guangxiensis]
MVETPDLKRRNFLLGRFTAEPSEPAGSPVALIGQSCFAFQGIACMSCRDACPTGAVRFELAIGGARPRIVTETCTGCGDCSQACPAGAIRVSAVEEAS